MKKWIKWSVVLLSGAIFLTGAIQAQQQQRQRPQQQGQFQPPQRGQFDPAQFQQRMVEGMLRALQITDEQEQKVIEPLLRDVLEKRRDLMVGGGFGFMGFRQRMGPGGPGAGPQPENVPAPVQKLQEVVEKEGATAAEIKAALAQYTSWYQQQEKALREAQEKLRSVLTLQQEARAVLMGLIPPATK